MQEKLVALHTLTEWQFDNPLRIRSQMKDDGDTWVCVTISLHFHYLVISRSAYRTYRIRRQKKRLLAHRT